MPCFLLLFNDFPIALTLQSSFNSNLRCKNCGATDHRHWECQEQKNITSQITCNKCGGYGHVAADCQVKQ